MATTHLTPNMNHVDNLDHQKQMNRIMQRITKRMKTDRMKLQESYEVRPGWTQIVYANGEYSAKSRSNIYPKTKRGQIVLAQILA